MSEKTPVAELNYEQAFAELQEMVAVLEAGQHTLDDALVLFERGQALAARCAELLDTADLKVQQLSAEGEVRNFEG